MLTKKSNPFIQEFRMFTKDTEHDDAKKKFIELYGYEPEICREHLGLLLVGPIKKKEE